MRRIIALLLALALLFCAPAALAGDAVRMSLAGLSPEALHNVRLAVWAVDGVWVPAGSDFSFNNTLRPRAGENGWLEAQDAAGREVSGGGADRAATALYRALSGTEGVRFEGLTLTDGSDAVDIEGGDLRFSTRDDLVLSLWIDGDALYCAAAPFDEPDPAGGYDGAMLPPPRLLAAGASLPLPEDAAARANIALAADSVYDTTLSAGDVFSFNGTVGPRSEAYGYRDAPDAAGETRCGGGVERLAGALWLAVEDLADVAILEKAAYGDSLAQDYVDSSADAILVDADADFAFRYTGEGSLTLFTYVEDGKVWCEVYGE